jgi:hypothetical protein
VVKDVLAAHLWDQAPDPRSRTPVMNFVGCRGGDRILMWETTSSVANSLTTSVPPHTVGPMKAAAAFVAGLRERVAEIDRVRTTVFGSLARTGKGHSSDKAIALGLCGLDPETLDPECSDATFKTLHVEGALNLSGRRHINYDPTTDIVFDKITHCDHSEHHVFEALDRTGCLLTKEVWLDAYLTKYLHFFDRFDDHNPQKVDQALMAFARFAKSYQF